MKLATYFDVLLRDTVNLNQTRLDMLQTRVDTVFAALQSDKECGDHITNYSKQGSWAHRTIIRPQNNKEFDADILLEMDEIDGWEPKDYINAVYYALGRNSAYGSMARTRKCRCVRLSYANDMHIDIVPHIFLSNGREVIVNRDENIWEETNPTGFTGWMQDKDKTTKGNLRKVIRLIKFLRDHKNSFTGTPSIIITTLLGNQVAVWGDITGDYKDLPTALLNLVESLDAWLQDRPQKPTVTDPSRPAGNFDHRWKDESYTYFRDRIHAYAADIRAAYDETDPDKSKGMWRDIFGDGFKAPASESASVKSPFAPTTPVAASVVGRLGRAG